jgi:ABC-type Fe3+ transport system substrate-binding protein
MSAARTMVVLVALLAATGFGFAQTTQRVFSTGKTARTLIIDSTTDTAIITPVIEAFLGERPEITIVYREMSTIELYAAAAANCLGGGDSADLVFSSAMDLQVKLVNDGCAQPVNAPGLDNLPDHARWRGELFGLTFEPAVIVYNRRLIGPLEAPKDHFDLLDLLRQSDRFSGKIGTYDIEASGLGYLYATLDAQQSSTFGRLIEAMGRSNVQLFCCTADILARVADGRLVFGYNVLGSYAFTEVARNPDLAIVLPSDYTLVLTRAAFVPKTAHNRDDAIAFMAFTQSRSGRRMLEKQARLFSPVDGAQSLSRQAGISDESRQSLRPIPLSPSLLAGIDAMKRRMFIRQWRESLGIVGD